MKNKIILAALGVILFTFPTLAQDKTTVKANSTDISDNLDLRAVATIFGDASDLEDFERRLNNPEDQISNLDLNGDNYVDYLRVIESVEGNAHIIVVQAVLDKDIYQDVATIEVEKDRNNNVQVQVVGDVYMYGDNYIYEPVYVHRPVIYTSFWVTNYRPYCSTWYWNYYPSYYTYWNPFPVFRYRNHISVHINFGHSYHYVNTRRCHTAYYSYYGRRGNGYEVRHPNRSFSHRNNGYSNRREMDNNRNYASVRPRSENPRNMNTPRSNSPRGNATPRNNNSQPRSVSTPRGNSNTPRTVSTPRNNSPRGTVNSPRTTSVPKNNSPREYNTPRGNSQPKSVSSPRGNSNTPRTVSTPRNNSPRGGSVNNQPRQNSPRVSNTPRQSAPRQNAPRVSSSNRGNSGSERSSGR